jgi:AcrR family transcriptional regulator
MSPAPAQPLQDLSERALAQRERVLCAAEQCFLRRGFHAASIADIAATAEMSGGLIYRYFENKNAIVMAIIERQLAEGEAMIDRLHAPGDVLELFLLAFDHWHQRSEYGTRAALFLEIAAEATRHPDIAATLRAADTAIRARLRAALQRHASASATDAPSRRSADLGRAQDGATLQHRTLLLQCLLEGLAVRTIRDPSLTRAQLRAALEDLLPRLLA